MRNSNRYPFHSLPLLARRTLTSTVVLLLAVRQFMPIALGADASATLLPGVASTPDGPRLELLWGGEPGAQYRVQSRGDLSDTENWRSEDLVTARPDAEPVRWSSPESLHERRYYRLAGPDPAIYSAEPAIAPPDAPVTMYVRGQGFQSNDVLRVAGAVIPGGNILSSALGRIEVPPQPPGVHRVELTRDGLVLSFFDVFFFDPGSDPFYSLQGPPEWPPAGPAAVSRHRGHVTVLKSHDDSHVTVLKRRGRGHVTVLKNHEDGGDEDCDGFMRLSPATGEVLQQETDLFIPGRGLDFTWTRTYRSRTGGDSPMGHGWTHSYDVHLASAGEDIAVHDGTGRRDVFRRQPDGSYTGRGFFREGRWDEAAGVFILEFADGGRWEFFDFTVRPASGKLAGIVDRNGNTMRFEYDQAARLARVTDSLDRTHTVVYDSEGRIAAVKDFTGRTVTYQYVTGKEDPSGSAGDLVAVISPPVLKTPTGNDFPEGKTNRYTYTRGFTEDRLNHNLLACIDGLGATQFELTYATTTNPADFAFDTVVRIQRGIDKKDIWREPLAPAPENDFAAAHCVINDFVGNVTEEYYDARHRLLRRLEFTGRANPAEPSTTTDNRPAKPLRADDPPFFETRWEWNNDSLCTALQQPLANRIEWVYQGDLEPGTPPRPRGNLRVQREIGDLDGDGRPEVVVSSFEHDPRFGTREAGRKQKLWSPANFRLEPGVLPLAATVLFEDQWPCAGDSDFNDVAVRYSTRVLTPRGTEIRCEYDDRGNRTSVSWFGHSSGATTGPALALEDFEYNAQGQLTAHVHAEDAAGRRRRDEFAYHDSEPQRGYLARAVMDAAPGGLALTTAFDYDAFGNATRVVDPGGHEQRFVYNSLDQVVRRSAGSDVCNPCTYFTDRHYDAANQLVRIEVENRDSSGRLNPTNSYVSTLYEYDSLHRLTRLMEEEGIHYGFLTNEFSYDGDDQLTQHRSPPAVHGLDPDALTQFAWDERGLIFRETRAPGSLAQSTAQWDYDANGNLHRRFAGHEVAADPLVTYAYDGLDRLVRATDAVGNATEYAYDANANLTRALHLGEINDLPGGDGNRRLAETHFEYDRLDRLVRRVDSFFDLSTGLPLGDGGRDTTFEYAANGQVWRDTGDRGFRTDYEYDSAGRLARVTDAMTNRVEYAYDANGNVLAETETGRSDLGGPDEVFVREYAYDTLNRPAAAWDNVGNTQRFQYDSLDRLVRHTDARGNDTAWEHDDLGRVVRATRYEGAMENGLTINTSHVEYQTTRLASSTDANGNTTAYDYDPLARPVRTTLADGTATSLVWSPRSNLERRIDANGTVTVCVYDALDRCVEQSVSPGPGVAPDTTLEQFAYDGLSRLVRARNDASEVAFVYDSLGNLARESAAAPALGFDSQHVDWLRDAHGLPQTQTHPSGRVVEYAYDALDRLVMLRTRAGAGMTAQPLGRFAYAGPDRLARVTRPNGIQTDYVTSGLMGAPNPPEDFGWKQVQRVRHALADAAAIIDEREFAHDPNQNQRVRALTVPFTPDGVASRQDFRYDALDRLVQSVTTRDGLPIQETTYVLDPNGNRQAVILDGREQPYLLDNTLPQPADFQVNQYTVTPLDQRQYDENGNLHATRAEDPVDPKIRRFRYDYANRLVAVEDAAGPVATYAYDALGRRIARVLYAGMPPVPAQTNRYLYAGTQLIEERDGGGALSRTHVMPHVFEQKGRIKDPIFTFDTTMFMTYRAIILGAGEIQYHLGDNQGSALALTDAAGNVIERYDYDDYGLPRFYDAEGNPFVDDGGLPVTQSPSGNPYLFHALRWDEEIGLYHNPDGAPGYLDPNTGSHLTRVWGDPHVDHREHVYAGNNPWSLKKEEGGRHTPFHKKYRPQAGLRTSDVTGEIELESGRDFGRQSAGGYTFLSVRNLGSIVRNRAGNPGVTLRSIQLTLPPGLPPGFQSPVLSDVRVHTGAPSHDIGAEAFAEGKGVSFGPGADLRAVAHELAHVVQQRGGQAARSMSPPGSSGLIEAIARQTRLSNAQKARHEAAMNSIRNMK